MILQLCVFLLPPLLVHGHGNMVHPPVWMDRSARTPEGRLEWPGCGVLDDQIPETEWQNTTQRSPSCLNYWFTNNTVTSGEVTIAEDMSQPEALCKQHGSTSNPWLAPGTAPVFSPCGTMGGNPLGCRGDGVGNFGDVCIFADETFPGGFAKGWNAEEFDWPGEIPVTEWSPGSEQEVRWRVHANHAGGYSYRLCRMPEDGIGGVTEDCFRERPLEFAGDKQWVIYTPDEATGHMTELEAARTTEGTSPPGSMWTANPFKRFGEGATLGTSGGEVVDYVKIPEEVEAGEYVLGFRWDCKCTPQVWTVCSNVLIL